MSDKISIIVSAIVTFIVSLVNFNSHHYINGAVMALCCGFCIHNLFKSTR